MNERLPPPHNQVKNLPLMENTNMTWIIEDRRMQLGGVYRTGHATERNSLLNEGGQ